METTRSRTHLVYCRECSSCTRFRSWYRSLSCTQAVACPHTDTAEVGKIDVAARLPVCCGAGRTCAGCRGLCMYLSTHTYIHREREGERGGKRERERERESSVRKHFIARNSPSNPRPFALIFRSKTITSLAMDE